MTLFARTRNEELKLLGWDEEQKAGFIRMQFNAQRQQYKFAFPNAENKIILLDGQAVGRILVNRSEDEIRLVDIAFLPEYRGGGIGSTQSRHRA